MKMDRVAASGNDEFYTPQYAIDPILKYIPPTTTVWCPFDTEQSLFVKTFYNRGNDVIFSHINDGYDFLATDYPDCDFVVSNPPYSIKTEVLARLFQHNIPFAMLVGVVGLFESQRRFEMFRDNPFEIMYFNRRVAYLKDYEAQKAEVHPPFSSVYICSHVLPRQIVFEEITKR